MELTEIFTQEVHNTATTTTLQSHTFPSTIQRKSADKESISSMSSAHSCNHDSCILLRTQSWRADVEQKAQKRTKSARRRHNPVLYSPMALSMVWSRSTAWSSSGYLNVEWGTLSIGTGLDLLPPQPVQAPADAPRPLPPTLRELYSTSLSTVDPNTADAMVTAAEWRMVEAVVFGVGVPTCDLDPTEVIYEQRAYQPTGRFWRSRR